MGGSDTGDVIIIGSLAEVSVCEFSFCFGILKQKFVFKSIENESFRVACLYTLSDCRIYERGLFLLYNRFDVK